MDNPVQCAEMVVQKPTDVGGSSFTNAEAEICLWAEVTRHVRFSYGVRFPAVGIGYPCSYCVY